MKKRGISIGTKVYSLLFMSQKEIELTTIQTEGSQESPPVNLQSETDDVDTRRSSISDLFFKYSTKKERFLLVFGFVGMVKKESL